MKRLKRMLLVALSVAMVLTINNVPVLAGSNAGNSKETAIKLQSGKKKTAKFRKGTDAAATYFVIGLEQPGRLSVKVSAKKLGTGATIAVKQMELSSWKQEKKISYNKSKKITSGTLKTEDILQKGTYVIEVTPGKALKSSKKFEITAKVTPYNTDDVEPDNNKEETAQNMLIYTSKKYKMHMSNGILVDADDTVDCFKLNVKDVGTVTINFKSSVKVEGVKVLLRQATEDGYTTVKTFDVVDGKLSEKVDVKKGTYYLKIWYSDDSRVYQMPYTIKCVGK